MSESLSKFPGIPAWSVRKDGKTIGIVRERQPGVWVGVAGHQKLGTFPTKKSAVAAVRSVS
jgi:hypothetical protein